MEQQQASAGGLNARELGIIVTLNLLPLAGVLLWGWKSFDLVFLYWMENLIIGVFTVVRMLVRPYGHPIDLAFPLLLAPFFIVHYGGFCYGHGLFVVSMFDGIGSTTAGLFDSIALALQSTPMLMAMIALFALQAFDWVRDSYRHGLGADGVKELMVAPYRRIVVLHVTILAGGFALTALGEPVIGLVALVAVKTLSDVWHWRNDAEREEDAEDFELTPAQVAEMREKFTEPKVTVNGKDKYFGSFSELKRSREFQMMLSVLRLMGARKELKVIDTYLDMQIAQESGHPGITATPR